MTVLPFAREPIINALKVWAFEGGASTVTLLFRIFSTLRIINAYTAITDSKLFTRNAPDMEGLFRLSRMF
jgi:hypothetical protein